MNVEPRTQTDKRLTFHASRITMLYSSSYTYVSPGATFLLFGSRLRRVR
jgi:hypothetical protein